jgi:isocitrate dehydrogenase
MPQVSADSDFVKAKTRQLVGSDIFIESALSPDELGKSLKELIDNEKIKLKMISNRGTKVYPDAATVIDYVDHWRCRFICKDEKDELTDKEIADLLAKISTKHKWMHIEKLNLFDGKPGFTKAQGED